MQELDERILSAVAQEDWVDRTAQNVQGVVRKLFQGSEAGRRLKDFLHGTWLAHPMHAMMTDVAVGAWTTAELMDAAEMVAGRKHWAAPTMAITVGMGGAVASAASGLADWTDTSGEQRRVGLIHAMVNVAAVTLYTASLVNRLTGHRTAGRILSAAGFSTVAVGSYLGGDLAYRLGTQVDRNAWISEIREFAPVMAEDQLSEDKPTKVEVEGIPILMVRSNGRIYAMHDTCSHVGCSLSEGKVEGEAIVCPCHGSTYRLEDGAAIHGPSPYAQPTYEVRVRNGQIEVRSELPIM